MQATIKKDDYGGLDVQNTKRNGKKKKKRNDKTQNAATKL